MTIRFKLTMASIAVILVAHCALSLVTMQYLGRVWLDEVQTRVRLDLNSARTAYNDHLQQIDSFLRGLSVSRTIAAALEKGEYDAALPLLQDAHRTGDLDFLVLLDPDGKVVCRARNPAVRCDDLSANLLVLAATGHRHPAQGTLIFNHEALLREGEDLASRACFELLPTPLARPTKDQVRVDGMVVASAVPILGQDGRLLGALLGGDLLNRRYEIVDAIRDDVYAGESNDGRPIGTVTIFQGDLRISTNVTLDDGSRAVGTRLSADVCEEVLDGDRTWAGPAWVVNDWYITAYGPIHDPEGKVVGALYVGLLQAPFVRTRNLIVGVFLAIVLGTTAATLVLLLMVTRHLLSPIGRIVDVCRRLMEGDAAARVGARPPGEMGALCQAVDSMADALADRERRLKRATSEQIGRSQKLAAIGRLAAGVAHEINNPLTGVLTFAHLLREKETVDGQNRQDLDVIIRETTRAAGIVRGLLDFSRERPPVKERLDINEVVRRTTRLLGNQQGFRNVAVVEDLEENVPPVDGDTNQLQQVLLNLSLNACEAMPNGGTLMLSTSADDKKVVVEVADTGCGIKCEDLERVFEPFFTTKPLGKGTGLGLSVSYGIVQQHGGTMEVESQEGRGTTFTLVLPAA